MTPDQAAFLAQQLSNMIEQEHPTTLRVLKAVPDAGRDYRPDDKSRTAWELATHIAQSNVWFLDSIVKGGFEFNKDAAKAQIDGFGNVAGVVAYYEQALPAALARVRAMPGEDLLKVLDFFGVFQWPGVQFLGFSNNHGIHHRGQLAAYLRAAGSKVPSIYGPSADAVIGG